MYYAAHPPRWERQQDGWWEPALRFSLKTGQGLASMPAEHLDQCMSSIGGSMLPAGPKTEHALSLITRVSEVGLTLVGWLASCAGVFLIIVNKGPWMPWYAPVVFWGAVVYVTVMARGSWDKTLSLCSLMMLVIFVLLL